MQVPGGVGTSSFPLSSTLVQPSEMQQHVMVPLTWLNGGGDEAAACDEHCESSAKPERMWKEIEGQRVMTLSGTAQ